MKALRIKLSPKKITSLKILLHLAAILPLVWLPWAFSAGRFSADPIPELIQYFGDWALRILLLSLCVSPLAKVLKSAPLIKVRRLIGLWSFAYASLHLLVWLWLDLQWGWSLIGSEIIKRGFVTLGMLSWLILLLLSLTSLQKIQRRLGRYWQRLHNWVYLAAVLIPIHYWWAVKSGWIQPLIYLLLSLSLLWWRRDKLLRPLKSRFKRPISNTKRR